MVTCKRRCQDGPICWMKPSSIMLTSVTWPSESGQKKFLSLRHPQSFLAWLQGPTGQKGLRVLCSGLTQQISEWKGSTLSTRISQSGPIESQIKMWKAKPNGCLLPSFLLCMMEISSSPVQVSLMPFSPTWRWLETITSGKLLLWLEVKRVFLSLDRPFENEKQHDRVVKVAFACHKLMKGKE